MEHKPSSPGGAILMFEPRGTSSTGDRHEGEIPDHVESTTGHYAEGLGRSSSRVAEELRRLGATAEVREMPESTRTATDAAAAVGCAVAQIVKSLVFRSVVSDEPVLVLVSGADRVDEALLAEVVGEAVEQATGKFVRERTGYAIGGVPPVGHAQPVVTYLDEHLLDHPLVWAAAGTPRAVFSIAPAELVRITSARVVAVATA
jgi:prolyl-tRNA editing enzyme YbaK/EbsC (Cys-tRNA(Pro) deacylase)